MPQHDIVTDIVKSFAAATSLALLSLTLVLALHERQLTAMDAMYAIIVLVLATITGYVVQPRIKAITASAAAIAFYGVWGGGSQNAVANAAISVLPFAVVYVPWILGLLIVILAAMVCWTFGTFADVIASLLVSLFTATGLQLIPAVCDAVLRPWKSLLSQPRAMLAVGAAIFVQLVAFALLTKALLVYDVNAYSFEAYGSRFVELGHLDYLYHAVCVFATFGPSFEPRSALARALCLAQLISSIVTTLVYASLVISGVADAAKRSQSDNQA